MPDDYTLLTIVAVINIVGGLYLLFRLRKYGVGGHNDAGATMLSQSVPDQRVTKGELACIRASLADIKSDVEIMKWMFVVIAAGIGLLVVRGLNAG